MSAVATAIIGSAVIGGVVSSQNSKRAVNAANSATQSADLQAQIGAEQWDRYQEIYDPAERKFVKSSFEYGTPADYQLARGDAQASVDEQFSKALERMSRRPGFDPSQAGSQATLAGLDLAQAASGAVQQNAATKLVTDRQRAYQTDALSLGKGLPASASSMLTSAASTQSQIANQQNQWGLNNAAGFGNIADRLLTPGNIKSVGNWLGQSSGGVSPAWTGGYDLPMGETAAASWGTGEPGALWAGPG